MGRVADDVGRGELVRRACLVTGDALLGHEVRVGPRIARGSVLVVDVDHEAVPCCLADRLVHPGGPPVRPDVNESEFQSCDPPAPVEREDLVDLILEGPVVHIEDHSHAPFAGNFATSDRINGHPAAVGRVLDRKPHLEVEIYFSEAPTFHPQKANLVVILPRNIIGRTDMNIFWI